MQPSDFVHLHCHSTYSLLEALPSPEEIVLRAKELGQNAVGIADKGYTYGLIEFYKAAKDHGIKPILGMEVYLSARTRHDKESGIDTRRFPLALIAETQEGYENLLKLATYSALEGMYYKPRVDDELLKKYGNGLIAFSGPISGAIPKAALNEDGEEIAKLTEKYRSFFGKNNLYFELMDLPNVAGQAEVNQQLIKWGKELAVPVVATCNSHYCRAGDSEAHDVLLCIQKNANINDTGRFSMRDSDFSMKPFDEMEKAFSHVPEALERGYGRVDVTHHHALGYLKVQTRRVHSGPFQRFPDHLEQTLVPELRRAEIHSHGNTFMPMRNPLFHLGQRFGQHKLADGADKTRLLRQWNELHRRHHAMNGMAPSDQSLHSCDGSGLN